ncbi:DUF4167 domain-containing protein [Microvirga lenta]|uniref:DUF4167 domain-containing protein n=1 Tax=Microvirga lenta TaxID=2881337 RepID=UPI001CFEB32A|nr:DUF4167 domain-containing protein [Microvirga lenta]MCB5174361.1 DUF4167 domain-containing protein [Microvirga lenta]
MRGRSRNNNNNKGPNPLTRSYESNGPDVKIRGTAQHIAEKYSQLARDAQASGDPVAAENYFQHAEHYFRIIAAAQEQLREQYGYQQRPFDEDGEDDGYAQGERSGFANGEDGDLGSQPQPFEQRQDGDRPARFDRGERQDRQDRGDRQDRQERGDRQDRGNGNRRERFQRDRGPRQDYQRDDQPRQDFDRGERDDQPRQERGERQDRNERFERPERSERQDRGERQERGGRGEFRRERRREEAEASDAGSLPAFLTNPVRAPVAVETEDKAPAPAPQEAANDEAEVARPRRRRRTRQEIEAANAQTEAGFEPAEVKTSAAE